MDLSARQKAILKAIIDEHIVTAEPVGSKTIASKDFLNYSSATIRNDMAELEKMGYLDQPHTSAGRVPTAAGYRLYVNELMSMHQLTQREVKEIKQALNLPHHDLDPLISEAGRMFSEITNQASVTVTPTSEQIIIRRFSIIPIDQSTFVLFLVTSNGIIHNKLVHSKMPINEESITLLSSVLNKRFADAVLPSMTKEKLTALCNVSHEATSLFAEIAVFFNEIALQQGHQNVSVGSAYKLLIHPEYQDVEKAQKLLDFVSEKENLALLPLSANNQINIIIGPESGIDQLNDASMIYTTYKINNNMQGVIGIIGPKRMDYASISSRLKYFSNGLNRLLQTLFLER